MFHWARVSLFVVFGLTVIFQSSTLYGEDPFHPGDDGKYTYKKITRGLDGRGYSSAVIYLPDVTKDVKHPAVVLSGGLFNRKEDVRWISERLASHGFIVLAFTPTSIFGNNDTFRKGHLQGLATLSKENADFRSPIFNLIDEDRLGLVGYSMGGGGAYLASEEIGTVRATVLLAPYLDKIRSAKSDTSSLIIVGANDTTASARSHGYPLYTKLLRDDRAYFEFKSLSHLSYINSGSNSSHKKISTYMVAWLKSRLMEMDQYDEWIRPYGAQVQGDLFKRRLF